MKLSCTVQRAKIDYFFLFPVPLCMGMCYAICCISVIMIAAMATMNQTNWHHRETEGGQAKEPKGTKIKIKWESERESVLQTW